MPFNTKAALYAFEARKHSPAGATYCQLCSHSFEISDQLIEWLLRQRDRCPFIQPDALGKMLHMNRGERLALTRHFVSLINRTILMTWNRLS